MKKKFPEIVERGRIRAGRYASPPGADYGAFNVDLGPGWEPLRVIASAGDPTVGVEWEHVSVSHETRCPRWDEMTRIKDLFFEPEEVVVQYHPAKSNYVNVHPNCLHLWRPTRERVPMPPKFAV